MASILAEISFLTSAREAALFRGTGYLRQIAEASGLRVAGDWR